MGHNCTTACVVCVCVCVCVCVVLNHRKAELWIIKQGSQPGQSLVHEGQYGNEGDEIDNYISHQWRGGTRPLSYGFQQVVSLPEIKKRQYQHQ